MKLILFLIFSSIILFGCTSDKDFDNSDFTSEISSISGDTSNLTVPFVAVGGSSSPGDYTIIQSTDALNWNRISLNDLNLNTGGTFRSITYGNEYVIVGDSGYYLSSNDSNTWELSNYVSSLPQQKNSIAYGNNKYLATGNGGSDSIQILVESNDGKNWSGSNFEKTNYYESGISIKYCLNKFFLLTSDFYSSQDGSSWTKINLTISVGSYSKLFCANGKIFISGNQNGILSHSSDGLNFTQISGFNTSVHGITYGKNLYVLIDDGGIKYNSTLNTNWAKTRDLTMLFDITYRNGFFIVVGQTGQIYTSDDGISFTQRVSPTGNSLYSVF